MNGQMTAQLLDPSADELIIRMYRTGLGDCFLLAFGSQHGPRYLLIDCGIHQLQTNGSDKMKQVMEDLMQSTNQRLDIVVGTHEHADHLSGIVQKESPFLKDEISIAQLWLAWTENPRIPQARRLRQKHNTAREIIRKAVKEARQKAQTAFGLSSVDKQRMNAFAQQLEFDADLFEEPDKFDEKGKPRKAAEKSFVEQEVVDRLKELKKKYSENASEAELRSKMGVDGNESGLGADHQRRTKPSSNELALELLVTLADQTRYCQPGDMLEVPGISTDDLRVWVLGPPRDEQRLKKDKPSKVRGEDRYKEVYLSGLDSARSLTRSPLMMDSEDNAEADGTSVSHKRVPGVGLYPFPASESNERFIDALEQELEQAQSKKKKRSSKASDATAERDIFKDLYFDRDSNWRRIDHEWLGNAETLALKLDSDTNNTSLVLAFEIGKAGEGPVLLFPGDAQVGNWLSWRDQTYQFGDLEMTADDLLRRTLVYKVGHHGSHNATVKCDPGDTSEIFPEGVPFGLELMDNIVAMIPTHRKSADKARGWEMPYKKLYEALREKADHRVLRSDLIVEPLDEDADRDIVPEEISFKQIPRMPHPIKWRRSAATFEVDSKEPLYYEIKIKR